MAQIIQLHHDPRPDEFERTAAAMRACLESLSNEAEEVGLTVVATLIGAASLALAEAIEEHAAAKG